MKLFDSDGPLMRAVHYLGELMLLNFLFLLCSLPVFTIGASASAMYTVTLRNAGGDSGTVARRFFVAFRSNFRRATVQWLIMLVIGAVLVLDYFILTRTQFAGSNLLSFVYLLCVFVYLPTLMFLFPVQAYYDNTVSKTMKNAMVLSLAKLPQTILMLALNAILIFLFFADVALFFRAVIFWFLFGFSATAQLCSRLLLRIFRKLTPKQ